MLSAAPGRGMENAESLSDYWMFLRVFLAFSWKSESATETERRCRRNAKKTSSQSRNSTKNTPN